MENRPTLTGTQQELLDILENYGIKRRCRCYNLDCLVIPYPMHKVMLDKIIRVVTEMEKTEEKGVKNHD